MKNEMYDKLEKLPVEETGSGQLVNGVVFMDPRVMEGVQEAKNFNFICNNETFSCGDDSNFICKTTLKRVEDEIKT